MLDMGPFISLLKPASFVADHVITRLFQNSPFHILGVRIDTQMIPGGNDVDFGVVTGFLDLINNLTDLWVGASEVEYFDWLLMEDPQGWEGAYK